MFLHFFYVTYKKGKQNYIAIIKSNENSIEFNNLNNLLYNNLHLLNSDNNINNLGELSNINYYEYFYIKKGLIIENQKTIWNNLLKIYLKNIDIKILIDQDYINNLYNQNLLLLDFDIYKNQIIDFLIEHYNHSYSEITSTEDKIEN
jgi:hypothetical protein